MDFGQLAEQLAGLFVIGRRSLHHDLDDLIAAPVLTLIEYALFAHSELLTALGALRDFQHRAPIDGWNLDLRPEAGLIHPHGNGDFDVVAVAAEEGVILDANGYVEVAGRSAHRARVPFTGNAQPRSGLSTGRNTDLNGLLVGDAAIPVAGGAHILQLA